MRRTLLGGTTGGAAITLLSVFAAPLALAVTFTVNSTLDEPDDLTMPGTCHTADGTCTLRAAMMQANRTSGVGATIMVPAGTYTLTIPAPVADGETDGDLNLTSPTIGTPTMTIMGARASTTIIDGNQLDRVFRVHPNRAAAISGLTIRNGFVATGFGGGIDNGGSLTVSNAAIVSNDGGFGGGIANEAESTLTVTNSTIGLNSAPGTAGGIFSVGSLTILNSTISQNATNAAGGGVTVEGGTAFVRNSVIYGNSANGGGGIANFGALYVIDSTITENNTSGEGGGIYNNNIANVYSSSIVYNGADTDRTGASAGGVFNESGATFALRNTLVAGNIVDNAPIYDDCTGTLDSYGRSLFWHVAGCTVTVVTGAKGTLNSLSDLGPLQDNGGPTFRLELI